MLMPYHYTLGQGRTGSTLAQEDFGDTSRLFYEFINR